MVNYIDLKLKLKCIAGHTEIVINGRRIRCAADYDRVLERITPATLYEFSAQLAMIKSMLC
jgi:hypothetical protein